MPASAPRPTPHWLWSSVVTGSWWPRPSTGLVTPPPWLVPCVFPPRRAIWHAGRGASPCASTPSPPARRRGGPTSDQGVPGSTDALDDSRGPVYVRGTLV